MKPKLIALALFAMTATTIVLYPQHQSNATPSHTATATPVIENAASVEVVFVLDTTSSMAGMIEAAKEKIWSIASTMASAQQAPEIKMGLVAFRDRGDAYVTRVVDLSGDLDSIYATLMDFQADGGGDTPESVNEALHDAVHRISWSQNTSTYRVVFLVGDSPPHMDYQNDIKYPDILSQAAGRGIVVNTIQCGPNLATTEQWQQIAQLGNGRYFQVDQAGSAVAIATPYDRKLAEISRKLDDTRLYYGSVEDKKEKQRKVDATDKLHAASSLPSRARRAVFNASASGRTNLFGEGELVEDVASGRVDLSTMDPDTLPAPMQAMTSTEQKTVIEEAVKERQELQREIDQLAKQRAAYIKEKVETEGDANSSLDEKIYSAVREQAAKLGLSYEAESSAY